MTCQEDLRRIWMKHRHYHCHCDSCLDVALLAVHDTHHLALCKDRNHSHDSRYHRNLRSRPDRCKNQNHSLGLQRYHNFQGHLPHRNDQNHSLDPQYHHNLLPYIPQCLDILQRVDRHRWEDSHHLLLSVAVFACCCHCLQVEHPLCQCPIPHLRRKTLHLQHFHRLHLRQNLWFRRHLGPVAWPVPHVSGMSPPKELSFRNYQRTFHHLLQMKWMNCGYYHLNNQSQIQIRRRVLMILKMTSPPHHVARLIFAVVAPSVVEAFVPPPFLSYVEQRELMMQQQSRSQLHFQSQFR
mmetsp:Transcript_5545/g.10043  ORF Transcript_5545/g.10043 Transcript_5545/m.10043 type:complete len:295 (-) Transcript_5545:51-935(-)